MKISRPGDDDRKIYKKADGSVVEKIVAALLEEQVDSLAWYHSILPPGSGRDVHVHIHLSEVYYFLTEGHMQINGEDYTFTPRTLVIAEPGEPHNAYAKETISELLSVKIPNIEGDRLTV